MYFLFNKIILCEGEKLNPMLIVEVFMDVCDIMGANTINTVCEHISPFISNLLNSRAGLRILSNFCTERRSMAFFEVPIEKMSYKKSMGEEVAYKILEAYRFA